MVRNRFLQRSLLLAVMVFALSPAASAAAAPAWNFSVGATADYFLPAPSKDIVYRIEAENDGDAPSSGQIALEDLLPPGVTATRVSLFSTAIKANIQLRDFADSGLCSSPVKCEYPGSLLASEAPPIPPGQKLVMVVAAAPGEGLAGSTLRNIAKVHGGGAEKATASVSTEVNADPPLGFHHFAAPLSDSNGNPYSQAGGHPFQFRSEFDPATRSTTVPATPATCCSVPIGDPKTISLEFPPGLIGNPNAAHPCVLAEFFQSECPLSSVVGVVGLRLFAKYIDGLTAVTPLIDLKPDGNHPAELGYVQNGLPFIFVAGLRTSSDYGVTISSVNSPQVGLTRARITTWGIPAEPVHDAMRGKVCLTGEVESFESAEAIERKCEQEPGNGPLLGGPAGVPEAPFLTMPTSCPGGSIPIGLRYDSWQHPEEEASASYTQEGVGGCNQLSFTPTIEARPTTNLPDSQSGFHFRLHIPQEALSSQPESTVEADLREAQVTLPEGLTVNPSSANGLGACDPAQIGLLTGVGATPVHFNEAPARCPDAAKIGTVEVDTPLLNEPLKGAVYVATPRENPFHALLAGYIVLEGEGLVIKLAGRFATDPVTGRITASFLENPQTPFEDFKFDFFEGARGALRTPPTCGSYEVSSVLTPWSAPDSGPPAEPASTFEITNGGAPCPSAASQQPNSPVFRAGTESAQAAAFSPFSLRLARADGSQEISKIETVLPPGLTGKLAGVTECSDTLIAIVQSREREGGGAEERANPACPASSEVGTVEVASGAGPTPLYVSGRAYLAGPYKGAPLSLAIVTPAVAGPFDLGAVVVRTALYVDPFTAQIKAVSDPIPHILQGIPLDVRSITLKMAHPNFTLNPTDCEELHFSGAETSLLGNVAPLAQRFQVGGCGALPFKPKLKLRLKGATKRSGFPALSATLTMPPGGANVAAAQVTLPHSAFLAQGHLDKTCGRPELLAHACPARSIYGRAKAWSPLLKEPLEGNVYLATGFGYKLPALVADLQGQIDVLLVGKVDTGREDGIRNTFEVVPDAPVSKFTLQMAGGEKSLIENHENLCAKHAKRKALARFTAQSGKAVELEPTVANSCKKGKGHRGHHQQHRGR